MHILVAFDGTEGAEAALEEAARLGRKTEALLTVAHVLNPSTYTDNPVATSTSEAMDEILEQTHSDLEARLERIEGVETAPLAQPLADGEDAAQCLARLAGEREVDMVAIGSRGGHAISDLVLGSVSRSLVGLSPRPVLVVEPRQSL